MQDRIWICKDGRQIFVSQMTDSHLQNCINKIMRHKNWRREYLDRLLLEQTIRSMGLSSKRSA